jgi:glycine cleavage system regulatory protein
MISYVDDGKLTMKENLITMTIYMAGSWDFTDTVRKTLPRV